MCKVVQHSPRQATLRYRPFSHYGVPDQQAKVCSTDAHSSFHMQVRHSLPPFTFAASICCLITCCVCTLMHQFHTSAEGAGSSHTLFGCMHEALMLMCPGKWAVD